MSEESKNKKSQADKLVDIVNEKHSDIELFYDEFKQPFAYINTGGRGEIWSCNGKQFKYWLSHLFWKMEHKIPHSNAVANALAVICGIALNEGKEYKLNNRIAQREGAIWYDLSNENWEAVRISKNGWQIVKIPPILFKRQTHQQNQTTPTANGDIKEFLSFVNVRDENKLLLLVYLVSSFIPDIPHPILVIHGPQGSAKSMLSKMIKRLVDPSILEVCDFPTTKAELAQILSHHHYVVFDNLSYISDSNSDVLCRAVTGGGFSKRELYTNDDDIIYAFKRAINLNGINPVATKPDLLERSMLLELERISNPNRKKESLILEDFQNKLPSMVGGIFDVISKAMQIKDSIKLSDLPRMADFTEWGCAIAEALGYSKQEFLAAYFANIKSQNNQVIYDSPVCVALLDFMDQQQDWDGTMTELLVLLNNRTNNLNIDTKERAWPKSAASLSAKINNFKTNLEEAGIGISRFDKDRQRQIYIHNNFINQNNSGNGIVEESKGDATTLSTLF